MTWPSLAAAHVGHRACLTDFYHLKCVDCSVTLLIPLRPDLAPTPVPPPFAPPTQPPASPETVAAARRRVDAELAALRQRKATPTTEKDETT